jgi:hypothetical protein
MKPTTKLSKLFWIRALKEPLIWILLVVCLYIVCAFCFTSIRLPSFFNDAITDSINKLLVNVSYSYIAGMLFYIFSIFYPLTRRARYILPIVVENVQVLKIASENLEGKLYGESWLKSDSETIISEMHSSMFENGQIIEKQKTLLIEYSNVIEQCFNSLLAYETYLNDGECKLMIEIQESFSIWQIRQNFGNLGMNETQKAFIQDIVAVYKKVLKLDKSLAAYRYDFQDYYDSILKK